jgi:antitoxin HigA-1
MIRIPTDRSPTHPGEMLLAEFLEPMGLTQKQLADGIHVPYQRINEIVNGKRGITPSTALRLAKFFGMSSDFWLNLQLRWDVYRRAELVFGEFFCHYLCH